MNITEREQNGITIFALDGRVDSEGAIEMELVLQAAVREGKSKIILEMNEVRYINSAGLRILADVLTTNRNNEGDLLLVAPNSKIQRVFEIIGFDNFFQIYDDTPSALAGF